MLKAEKSNSVFDLKAFKNRAMHFAFGAAFLAAFAFHYPIIYLVKSLSLIIRTTFTKVFAVLIFVVLTTH